MGDVARRASDVWVRGGDCRRALRPFDPALATQGQQASGTILSMTHTRYPIDVPPRPPLFSKRFLSLSCT